MFALDTPCNSFKNPGRKVRKFSDSTDKGAMGYQFSRTSSPRPSLINCTRKEDQSFTPLPPTEFTVFYTNSSDRDLSKNSTRNFSICKLPVPPDTLNRKKYQKPIGTINRTPRLSHPMKAQIELNYIFSQNSRCNFQKFISVTSPF